jgi:alpha-tubulin suppressor-like RCC1 family protein
MLFDVSDWNDIVAISATGEVLIGLKEDGTVMFTHTSSYIYGDDVSNWKNVVQVSAGNMFALGLCSDGKVEKVGRDLEGQIDVDGWHDIIQIATGHRFSVGLDKNGNIYFAGQYSDKFREQYERNKKDWNDIIAIYAAGGYKNTEMGHVVGIKKDKSVVCLGDDFIGGKNTFRIEDLKNIRLLAVGDYHIIAVTENGSIILVGNAGTIEPYNGQNEKELIENWPTDKLVDVVAGRNLTIGLTSNGETYSFGAEKQGQLQANEWTDIKVLD